MSDRGDPKAAPGGTHPDTIGEYRIIRVLGEGGMGTVYEAEQTQPRRRVALKVIRAGRLVTPEHIRLFRREAQALALLSHPSVAQIYESGRTPDGQHFFAMELVRGTSLAQYMTLHAITASTTREEVRSVLNLFREVCDAVSYAHQRGVIHRDLKPSNIVVVRDASVHTDGAATGPHVKILDFGIARITDGDTAYVTQGDRVVGTLRYMSPEQAGGNPDEIDLRSDIYSLGVILYELLTGRLPYDIGGLSFAALYKILNEPPKSPSAVWREMGRRMDPDIETILLKALSKDPSRRYQSAWAMAEDVERYLSGQPILARPPDAWYQIRKLAARHRTPVYSGAFVVVALAIGVFDMERNRSRAEAARQEAVAQAARAEAVTDFLLEMLGSADPRQGGRDARVIDVLEGAASRVDESFPDQPRVAAAVLSTIGETYMQLGGYPEARELLTKSLQARQALDDPDVGVTLDALGTLELVLGNYDAALVQFDAAIADRRQRLGPRHELVARSINNAASVHIRQGNYDAARPLLREAVEIHEESGNDFERSIALENLATTEFRAGAFATAERAFVDALELRRSVVGDEHLDIATGHNNLAIVLTSLERFGEAESHYFEALDIYRRLLGEEHPSVARGINNLGMFYYRQQRYDEAEPRFRKAAELNEAALGPDHPEVGANLNNLGLVLRDTDRFEEAEAVFRRSLEIDLTARPGHPSVPDSRNNLGALMVRMGRYAEAEALYRTARIEYIRLFDENDYRVASTDSLLGECLTKMGRPEEGARLLEAAFERLTRDFPVEHGRVQATIRRLIEALDEAGRAPEAERFRAMLEAA